MRRKKRTRILVDLYRDYNDPKFQAKLAFSQAAIKGNAEYAMHNHDNLNEEQRKFVHEYDMPILSFLFNIHEYSIVNALLLARYLLLWSEFHRGLYFKEDPEWKEIKELRQDIDHVIQHLDGSIQRLPIPKSCG